MADTRPSCSTSQGSPFTHGGDLFSKKKKTHGGDLLGSSPPPPRPPTPCGLPLVPVAVRPELLVANGRSTHADSDAVQGAEPAAEPQRRNHADGGPDGRSPGCRSAL